jgi:hypothetical protein
MDIFGFAQVQKVLQHAKERVGPLATQLDEALKDHAVKRDAAKDLKVPQKAITSRLYTSKITNRDAEGKLWAGTWDISPFKIKAPRQTKRGVGSIAGRKYTGAWIGAVYGKPESIWIRKRSKYYTPDLYPQKRKKGTGSVPDELKHRFPVVKAAIPIEDIMEKVFDRDDKDIRKRFEDRLQAQINFALRLEAAA